jgi:hypothetical protein
LEKRTVVEASMAVVLLLRIAFSIGFKEKMMMNESIECK